MTNRLAKICPLLPFALYGLVILLLFMTALDEGNIFSLGFTYVFGWIPSLISSALGVVFSSLSLKDGGKKIFLILSLVNLAVSVAWMTLILLNL